MATMRMLVEVDYDPEVYEVDPLSLMAEYVVYLMRTERALTARAFLISDQPDAD